MDKEERENRILEEFYRLNYRTEFFTAFRDGWLSGYRMAKEEELLKRLPSLEERNENT